MAVRCFVGFLFESCWFKVARSLQLLCALCVLLCVLCVHSLSCLGRKERGEAQRTQSPFAASLRPLRFLCALCVQREISRQVAK